MPNAALVGDVRLGPESSVWFDAVLRADDERIVISARGNVRNNRVLHIDPGIPITVGDNVTIGPNAVVHGCTIGDSTLIATDATLLNGARIGRNCLIGAGALVTEGKVIPTTAWWLALRARSNRGSTRTACNAFASAGLIVRRSLD